MNTTRLIRILVATATAFSLATVTQAAQFSFTAKTPTPGPHDVANLTGANSEINNVNDGDNDATYIADDRPIQGQTFTTGTNAAGYQLRSVALREVKHDTYAMIPDLKYTIRITQASGKTLEIIATEMAEVAGAAPGNFPTIGDGGEMGSGSGNFIAFTFDKPITLKPNTTYGFDVGGGDTRHYWQTDGTSSDTYASGEAYSSGKAGKGGSTRIARTGDHVFVVSLIPSSKPVANQAKTSTENKAANQ